MGTWTRPSARRRPSETANRPSCPSANRSDWLGGVGGGGQGKALSTGFNSHWRPTGEAVQQKISAYRQQAYAQSYQTFLLAPQAQVTTSFADGFAFDNRPYPAAWSYSGAYQFKKHFFGSVGELASTGEEFECAKLLDTLPAVTFWIRNLSTRPQTSFWLPTSTDHFYPDFVALLEDGRIFVLEYKGEHLITADEAKEKINIGQLWAAKSDGKGLFLMAQERDERGRSLKDQIPAALV